MPNADKLWNVVQNAWPVDAQWLTIDQVAALAPKGTEGINNHSSYDFAVLTMLSTARRNYIVHQDSAAQEAIDDHVVRANRNNGIWKRYPASKVRRAS
jgi:hypothetical protein